MEGNGSLVKWHNSGLQNRRRGSDSLSSCFMKRFFLYLLLFLFIAGLAALAFGFYNAKKIRVWAFSVAEIKTQHDVFAKEKDVEARFDSSGGKKMEELKTELASFSTDLDAIFKETQVAQKEIDDLGGSAATKAVRSQIDEYYQQSGEQAKNVASIVKFMRELFEVAVIFDRIKADSTLEEIQNMIGEAKSKSAEVDAEALPEEMKTYGNSLKAATDDFLAAMEQSAKGSVDGNDALNASYENFSQKENDFFSGAKKYISMLENLNALRSKIDNGLLILEKVQFSLK